MTHAATELAKQLFGDGLRAVKETAQAVAPGLDNLIPDIKAEAKQQLAAGAHELAAALFNGSGFVMYPRQTGRDDHGKETQSQDGQGVHGPENSPTQGQDASLTHERGGRSM